MPCDKRILRLSILGGKGEIGESTQGGGPDIDDPDCYEGHSHTGWLLWKGLSVCHIPGSPLGVTLVPPKLLTTASGYQSFRAHGS